MMILRFTSTLGLGREKMPEPDDVDLPNQHLSIATAPRRSAL